MQNNNPSPEQIQGYIQAKIECQTLEITGDGHHFYATIVSESFNGLSQIQRHKHVYAALGERMKQEIHAFSMKTYTPEEFKNL